MTKTVSDLIRERGGPDVIALASQDTLKPISADAVHKWRRNGIPDEHWGIFTASGVCVETIYLANEIARRAKSATKPETEEAA